MTPHRSNRRGTYLLDRVFNGIGRIKVASGTNDKATFRSCDRMLTTLYQTGHPELLELIRDGKVKAVFVYGYFRQGRLEQIPVGPMAKDLQADWTDWLKGKQVAASHRRALRLTGKALGEGMVGEIADRLDALVAQKAGKATAQRQHRVHVQAYLSDRFGSDHPLYLKVKAVKHEKVVAQDKATPLSVGQVRELMAKMPEGALEDCPLCRRINTPEVPHAR